MIGMRAVYGIILILAGCARPNYASSPALALGNGNQQGTVCQARFASGHCVSYAWEILPTEEETGALVFKTYRENRFDGSPVMDNMTGAPALELWMPSMNHGSSPVAVEEIDVGTYRAKNVFFTMKGEWELRFQRKNGDDVLDQAIISLSL